MTTVAIIPARMASTRFPGKPLARDTGKYLVQHVYEQTVSASLVDRVIVATDDAQIVEAVESFGGEARMTRPDHLTGTERVAEVAVALQLRDDDIVLNVQGDEPEIEPRVIDQVVQLLMNGSRTGSARQHPYGVRSTPHAAIQSDVICSIATAAVRFRDAGPREGPGSPLDPNRVKVVLDADGRALYFSRSPIPYPRDTGGKITQPSRWLLHLGLYAFRASTLCGRIAGNLAPSELETTESLEQLRWLQNGIPIAVTIVDHAFFGVDTPEDYAAFVQRYQRRIVGRAGSARRETSGMACGARPTGAG